MIVIAVLTLMSVYFAKKEYEAGRIAWAMFWACLLGWDVHTLLSVI
jgi:hypothetical protein